MTAGDWGLLQPTTAGTRDAAGDDQVLAAMVRVEAALLRAWAAVDDEGDGGAARLLDSVAADPTALDRDALVAGVARDGVAVVALVGLLRQRLDRAGLPAARLHAGATSQDVLDTALMQVARATFAQVRVRLVAAGTALAVLADAERDSPRVGHTLGRNAAPTTLGVQIAGWLDGISSAVAAVDGTRFPVQLGGAVGTGEQADRAAGRPGTIEALRATLAAELGLDDPGRSWHTERTPVLAVATAASTVTAALGRVGRDLVMGSREGVDELGLAGGGASSAMPHKRNPVGPVAMSAAALQAPGLLSTVARAAVSVDERPAGEWHAEWSALRDLLRLAGGSADAAARTVSGLTVHRDAAARNLRSADVGPADAVTLAACRRVADAAIARFQHTLGGERP
ncbi:lyase family protein [Cellulomonas sp. ICMP 17802]|uniref:lyase family protein n=1 Tax=Cellulomonas sp. ICMP 17802 TaxID=3239199 RepID=UPI00351B4C27